MAQVCIRGVGCYLPDARLTNQALATRLGVTDDYIVKLTGIRERRRAAPEEATSDMAVLAAQDHVKNVDGWTFPDGTGGNGTPGATTHWAFVWTTE